MSQSNTPPVRNRAPLTARSCSLRCVSAAEHQTAEQCSKTGRTKPWKHLPRSDLSWNTRHDFLKIPSLCEAALETEQRCFSKVIFELNVTPKIARSSHSFSTVPPIVNGGWLGTHCARPRDYHSLGLIHIQFHPSKVTQLTNPARSRIRDCYCNPDAWGWHNSHQSGVISMTDQLIFQNGKKLQSVHEEQ